MGHKDEDVEADRRERSEKLFDFKKLNVCKECNGKKIVFKKTFMSWLFSSKKSTTCGTCKGTGENSANKDRKRELECSKSEVDALQARRTYIRKELNELNQSKTDTLDKICKLEDKLNEADANKSQDNAYRRNLQRNRV